MPTNTEVATALEAAADLYESEKYDWCQGSYHQGGPDSGISLCASQALRMACGERLTLRSDDLTLSSTAVLLNRPLFQEAVRALGLGEPPGLAKNYEGLLISWNDHQPKDSKQEVIDLFKNTAKKLRNEA